MLPYMLLSVCRSCRGCREPQPEKGFDATGTESSDGPAPSFWRCPAWPRHRDYGRDRTAPLLVTPAFLWSPRLRGATGETGHDRKWRASVFCIPDLYGREGGYGY